MTKAPRCPSPVQWRGWHQKSYATNPSLRKSIYGEQCHLSRRESLPHCTLPPPRVPSSSSTSAFPKYSLVLLIVDFRLMVDFRLLLSESLRSVMLNMVRRIERGIRVNIYSVNHPLGRASQNMLNFLENGKFTSNKHLA